MERNDVVCARSKFLREMNQLKKKHDSIVYLDKTWVNQNYTVNKCWINKETEKATGIAPPMGKGSRLIILDAGTKYGFTKNTQLIFKAKNDGDYHNHMNSIVFQQWFQDRLLPNYQPSSAIMMENASYHSMLLDKQPTSAWKKEDIVD